jgi:hypothetical protein
MKVGDKIYNYCIACTKDTNHVVLCNKEEAFHDEYEQETTIYTIVQCAGCNKISYRTENTDYLHYEQDEFGEYYPSVSISTFPKVLKRHKNPVRWYQLPKKIGIVYNEAVKAFASECYLLTGVAFRAVIEAICIDKKIAGKDLYVKISNLVKSKLITENEANRLHAIRFIGNDSVHEMTVPDKDTLYIVLNTIEHLLNNLYIIDEQIKNNLETVVNTYEDFIELLNTKIDKLQSSDSFSLNKILGKSLRRLNDKGDEFEKKLIEQINAKEYLKLSINEVLPHQDKKRADVHYYKITDSEIEQEEPTF